MSAAPGRSAAIPAGMPSELSAWAAAFAAAATATAEVAAGLTGTAQGRARLGKGAGGDVTFEIDRAAEAAALEQLRRSGLEGQVLSEEQGRLTLGSSGSGPLMLMDPVDGSLNAKRGIPVYSTAYALMGEERLGSVRLALIHDLVRGETFWSWPGGGVWLGEERLPPPGEGDDVEMLAFEVSSKAPGGERLALALQFAHRVRILGSQALALAYCAAGRADALLANTSRSIDCAAGLLMVREAGGAASDVSGADIWEQPIGLQDRISLAVGSTPERHAALVRWLKVDVLAAEQRA